MDEIWKDIFGYEGLYQVSNLGNVKSLSRIVYNGKGTFILTEKLLKLRKNKQGYLQISLNDNNHIRKSYQVHRLVALAFLPNPQNLSCVNHKDENKTNNCVDNLEWCTQKYNVNYGSGITKRSTSKSKPVIQYDLDLNIIKIWNHIIDCKESGFNNDKINECCKGLRKTHKGYIWKYNI